MWRKCGLVPHAGLDYHLGDGHCLWVGHPYAQGVSAARRAARNERSGRAERRQPMTQMGEVVTPAELQRNVEDAVQRTPVFDVHTHLYPAGFAGLCLWGIDELVNYHYLVAELFRSSPVTPD